jgi:hypothetical protein
MIGRLLYQYRRKFGHGFRTAWWREIGRKRILKARPTMGLTDDRCEIHALTWRQDWLDLVLALKTLFCVSGCRFRLCIHDDGSLPTDAFEALRHQFPDARLIRRSESDRRLGQVLRDHPRCKALRDANILSLKVFDFAAFLESERMFLLDCDIVFFSEPTELIGRLTNPSFRDNSLNRDWANGYSIDLDASQALVPFQIQPLVNSGLGLIHKDSYSLNDFEEWLGLPNILSHSHRIEQTLVGLACSKYGHQFLPSEYDVTKNSADAFVPVKHYTGPIRHLLYSEGVPRALRMLKL